MKRILLPLAVAALAINTLSAQYTGVKPKLVVNIVVSQMRYDYLDRFGGNFTGSGIRFLTDQGVSFRNAHHDYMQTLTVAGLATINTGANPSEHGIIAEKWVDFTTGSTVDLIADNTVNGLDADAGVGRYSPRQLIAGTLGDRLREVDPASKVVSIASSPYSAVVSGGFSADTYWMDENRGTWISSTFYFDDLPFWVKRYNDTKPYEQFQNTEWTPARPTDIYRNTERTALTGGGGSVSSRNFLRGLLTANGNTNRIAELMYTPFGNTLTTMFAREAIISEELGRDDHTDLITVVYDTPRYMCELFGPSSVELEDMYYQLDMDISSLVSFVMSHVGEEELLVILSSDHGSSDTYREESRVPMGRFSAFQFAMIMNGFLSAQYEPADWVVEYYDRQLYLNRDLIFNYGFDLAEMQSRAAAFAMQFSGVSGAFTSMSMQSGYFGKGYAEKVQNGFYPKRSGDITINLMPGWIEEKPGVSSSGGSLYKYDTHVPLAFFGLGMAPQAVDREVDMRSITPTLSRIMRITAPNASSGEDLTEIGWQQR